VRNKPLWERYVDDTSFRFLVTAYQNKIPQARQKEVIDGFAYMGFLGRIDMRKPEITLVCFEECRAFYTPYWKCLTVSLSIFR
jgi:tRNA (guanine10-N2)-methyltransferase